MNILDVPCTNLVNIKCYSWKEALISRSIWRVSRKSNVRCMWQWEVDSNSDDFKWQELTDFDSDYITLLRGGYCFFIEKVVKKFQRFLSCLHLFCRQQQHIPGICVRVNDRSLKSFLQELQKILNCKTR